MNFQGALTLLKEGKKVRRARWHRDICVSKNSDGEIVHQGLFVAGFPEDVRPFLGCTESLLADDWEERKEPLIRRLEKVGNFQCALTMLKNGCKLRRSDEAWPNTHVWIEVERIDTSGGRILRYGGASNGNYTLSASDLFAEDWYRIL